MFSTYIAYHDIASKTLCPDARSRKLSFNLGCARCLVGGCGIGGMADRQLTRQMSKLILEESTGDDGIIYLKQPMKFKVDVAWFKLII